LLRSSEKLRIDLEKRHDFSTFGCFQAIDTQNEGEVNIDNLRIFFKENGYYPLEDELVALVRRIDVDADAKISYPEFCDTIKPQDFSRSKAPEQSQQQFS
jgi:Ca2+-binding EF-hand superfamily protein